MTLTAQKTRCPRCGADPDDGTLLEIAAARKRLIMETLDDEPGCLGAGVGVTQPEQLAAEYRRGFEEGHRAALAWQPIETAPRGVWMLTYAEWSNPEIGVSKVTERDIVVETVESEHTNAKGRRRIIQEEPAKETHWHGEHWEPTHWMPLPVPPAA